MLPAVRLSTMKQSRLLKRNSTCLHRAPNLRKQGSFTIYSSSFGGQLMRLIISFRRNQWANLCSFSINWKHLPAGNNCSRRGQRGPQQWNLTWKSTNKFTISFPISKTMKLKILMGTICMTMMRDRTQKTWRGYSQLAVQANSKISLTKKAKRAKKGRKERKGKRLPKNNETISKC